ncbi:MAG: hypothetical protein AB7I79_22310 [Rhizobiaceae bacterium]
MAPAETSQEITSKIEAAVTQILSDQEFAAKLADQGLVVRQMKPDVLAAFLDTEDAEYRAIIESSSIPKQ